VLLVVVSQQSLINALLHFKQQIWEEVTWNLELPTKVGLQPMPRIGHGSDNLSFVKVQGKDQIKGKPTNICRSVALSI
jgi:hypothetical protein